MHLPQRVELHCVSPVMTVTHAFKIHADALAAHKFAYSLIHRADGTVWALVERGDIARALRRKVVNPHVAIAAKIFRDHGRNILVCDLPAASD
jgi:hypothetical protein